MQLDVKVLALNVFNRAMMRSKTVQHIKGVYFCIFIIYVSSIQVSPQGIWNQFKKTKSQPTEPNITPKLKSLPDQINRGPETNVHIKPESDPNTDFLKHDYMGSYEDQYIDTKSSEINALRENLSESGDSRSLVNLNFSSDYDDYEEIEDNTTDNGTFKPEVETQLRPAVPRLRRVVCNFNSSSMDRNGVASFMVQNVNADYCTDIYYDHAEVRKDTYKLKSISKLDVVPLDENLFLPRYIAINDLKLTSQVRTFLTVTESQSLKFTELAYDKKKSRAFVASCVRNLRLWGFDGLAIKWPYPPKAPELTRLLMRLRIGFNKEKIETLYMRLQLGVILSGNVDITEKLYEVQAINDLVDQITVMVYEAPDYKSGKVALTSTLYSISVNQMSVEEDEVENPNITVKTNDTIMNKNQKKDTVSENSVTREKRQVPNSQNQNETAGNKTKTRGLSVDAAVREWVRLGADKSKINIAISLIGHSYTLKTAAQNGLDAPVSGPGPVSLFDGIQGHTYSYEMCARAKKGKIMRASEKDSTPYWYDGKLWISYEDKKSIAQKTEYLKESSIGGIMLVSQSEDDFSGTFCDDGLLPLSKMVYHLSNHKMLFKIAGELDWPQYCSQTSRITVSSLWAVPCIIWMVLFQFLL